VREGKRATVVHHTMPNVNERPLPLDFVCSFGWFAANLCEQA
jgi:hypothetical protein